MAILCRLLTCLGKPPDAMPEWPLLGHCFWTKFAYLDWRSASDRSTKQCAGVNELAGHGLEPLRSVLGARTLVFGFGEEVELVSGTFWFDHQWGDFISVGGGGWDWFAVNLDDGTDLTISLVRDADGSYPLVYGTIVDPDGAVRHLDESSFTLDVTDRWTSEVDRVGKHKEQEILEVASAEIGLANTIITAAKEAGTEPDRRRLNVPLLLEASHEFTLHKNGAPA